MALNARGSDYHPLIRDEYQRDRYLRRCHYAVTVIIGIVSVILLAEYIKGFNGSNQVMAPLPQYAQGSSDSDQGECPI